MSDENISKLARYVAFLYRESTIWRPGAVNDGKFDCFMLKIDTAKDICTMLGCKDKVWSEATKIYDFTKENF